MNECFLTQTPQVNRLKVIQFEQHQRLNIQIICEASPNGIQYLIMQAYRQPAKQYQSLLDMTKINSDSDKCPQQSTQAPKQIQHFEQFKKIYLTSYLLSSQKYRLSQIIKSLHQSLTHLQQIQQQITNRTEQKYLDEKQKQKSREGYAESKESHDRIKRCRRKADDIDRKWECKEQYCGRKYGAHASLLQHVKLKHPFVYQQYC